MKQRFEFPKCIDNVTSLLLARDTNPSGTRADLRTTHRYAARAIARELHAETRCVALLRLLIGLLAASGIAALAADVPPHEAHDCVLTNFQFHSGERFGELRMHFVTFGAPQRDSHGIVRNAVLVLHGTTGSSSQFLVTNFSGVLFGQGQLLDAARYFIIIPDNIGHGASAKPSDGLHAKFPKYGYRDMIDAQYRLLTE